MNKAPDLMLSIDFEDFAHDLKRDLGIWDTGPLRIDALHNSYDRIQSFIESIDDSKRVTFFCTGIIAEREPQIIRRIADDGHEVACHYHFHDDMVGESEQTVDTMVKRAKHALEDASGQDIYGFRAPRFRIDKENLAQYEIIRENFDYDSSWFGPSADALESFKDGLSDSTLEILPIYSSSLAKFGPRIKLGGSYMKLFPTAISDKLIKQCYDAGLTPHIYLHPYEFDDTDAFRVSNSELAVLGWRKATYWSLRQHQWHTLGNKNLLTKVKKLFADRRLTGRLRDQLALA